MDHPCFWSEDGSIGLCRQDAGNAKINPPFTELPKGLDTTGFEDVNGCKHMPGHRADVAQCMCHGQTASLGKHIAHWESHDGRSLKECESDEQHQHSPVESLPPAYVSVGRANRLEAAGSCSSAGNNVVRPGTLGARTNGTGTKGVGAG